jgi:hypothetical protein
MFLSLLPLVFDLRKPLVSVFLLILVVLSSSFLSYLTSSFSSSSPAFLLPPAYAQTLKKTGVNGSSNDHIVLESKSDQGTFIVRMNWTTASIGLGNAFDIQFVEPETGKELEQMTYDFVVISNNGHEVVHRQSQALARQDVAFSERGPYVIKVANIDGIGEGASFSIVVAPEFQSSSSSSLSAWTFVAAVGLGLATILGLKKLQKRL